jgi:hypothetical protein
MYLELDEDNFVLSLFEGQPLVQFSAESADFAIINPWSSKKPPRRFHIISVPSK